MSEESIMILDDNGTVERKILKDNLKEKSSEETFNKLKSIIEQDVITDDDATKFKEILPGINQQDFIKTSWESWLYKATQKSRFDIALYLFDLNKSFPIMNKLTFYIRFFPNDDMTIKKIKLIINEIEDIYKLKNYMNYGNTLLDWSCRTSKIAIVETLIDRGMNLKDMHSFTFESPECLQLVLFNKGAVRPHVDSIINKKDSYGYTSLHKAAQRRCKRSVQYLLEAGANFGTVNDLGESCISQIDPETLEAFLTEKCIKTNNEPLGHKRFELTFDYRQAIKFHNLKILQINSSLSL